MHRIGIGGQNKPAGSVEIGHWRQLHFADFRTLRGEGAGQVLNARRHAGADFAVILMEMADHANAQPLHAAIQA